MILRSCMCPDFIVDKIDIGSVPRYFLYRIYTVLWEPNYTCGLQLRRLVSCQFCSSGIHELLLGWLNLPRKNDHTTVVNYLAETTFILQWKLQKKKQCRNKHLTSCIYTNSAICTIYNWPWGKKCTDKTKTEWVLHVLITQVHIYKNQIIKGEKYWICDQRNDLANKAIR